jgi:hypothetical protein
LLEWRLGSGLALWPQCGPHHCLAQLDQTIKAVRLRRSYLVWLLQRGDLEWPQGVLVDRNQDQRSYRRSGEDGFESRHGNELAPRNKAVTWRNQSGRFEEIASKRTLSSRLSGHPVP